MCPSVACAVCGKPFVPNRYAACHDHCGDTHLRPLPTPPKGKRVFLIFNRQSAIGNRQSKKGGAK